MVGILTEKASAAKNFIKALGGKNGVYNGEHYTIVHAHGHLYELAKPEFQVAPALAPKYKSWALSNLPWDETAIQWKKNPRDGSAAILKEIKTTLSACDEIVIATDDDPTGEGELLAWEILSALNLKKKTTRMYFPDEAVKSIQDAFVSRVPIKSMMEDMDYVKGDYRSRFDYLTMQFTRIATQCGDGKAVLRQGRLKSAMVQMVGDQLALVKAYKKVPYYQNRFRDENGVMYSDPKEPQYANKADVPEKYSDSSVVCDSKTMKATAPPKLLDLAGLSAILSERGIKAEAVLSTYQKMYESQVVSYPRTDTQTITHEQFTELLPYINDIAKVVDVDVSLLSHRTPRLTHVNDKTAGTHGANRPGTNVPTSLTSLRAEYGEVGVAIYTVLAKNYLAILAEDYLYETQKGHVVKYPTFVGSCNVPKSMGWKQVYNEAEDEDPSCSTKGLGTLAKPFVHEGFPQKPQTPTMKWLMAQLLKRDVGTGSTRTSIYADVTNEKAPYPLLKETKGKISMTQYGEMSYTLLPGTHIGDLKLTEQLQADMRLISSGKADPEVCLSRVKAMVLDDIETMRKNGAKIPKVSGAGTSTAAEAEKEYCEGTWKGKAIRFKRTFGGHRFTDEECAILLDGKEVELHDLVSAAGKPYAVTGKLAQQTYNGHPYVGYQRTAFLSDTRTPKPTSAVASEYCAMPPLDTATSKRATPKSLGKCPMCGNEVQSTKYGYACTQSECRFSIAGTICSHKVTDKDVRALLSKGKAGPFKNFVSKKTGRNFTACLELDEAEGKINFLFEK